MKAVVSEKGQVTIPKEVRERLGLAPGTAIEFDAVDGALVGRKVLPEDPIARWRGRGQLPGACATVDDYLSAARDADGD
jgi:AbrB family looped-hinge helix DNA binding protein